MIISAIIGLILIVGGITLYRTYALYEEKKEFNVLKGKVPDFSNADIKLSFTINGEKQVGSKFPDKREGYGVNTVECKNGVTAEWNNIFWGLINIKNTSNSERIECTIHFSSEIPLSETVEIGNYISYTPSVSSYSIPRTITGYSANQTIKPNELNLWRVIHKNDDGTIEIISENASSAEIYFTGQTGYKNLVGGLNTIAKQYENSEYTIGSKNVGYNGQTATLTTLCTSSSCEESKGGGDSLSEEQMEYVKNAIGSLSANIVGTSTESTYWVSSRFYQIYNGSHYGYGRFVDKSALTVDILYQDSGLDRDRAHHIRPVVILKSGLKVTGSGTSEKPWKLS